MPKDDPRLQLLFKEAGLGWNDLQTAIPCWPHGDGVEYVDGRSLVVYSFGSALCQAPSLDSSLLICGYPKDTCLPETWEHLWAHVVPAFQDLQAGHRHGHSRGYRFILWHLVGDQDHYANNLHLPHWQNLHPCWECKQTKEECMTALTLPVPLEKMRTEDEEYNCRLSTHPLFTLPGLSHFNVCQDAMHILFCKGLLSHCMGNALKHWCWHSSGLAGTAKARLQVVWTEIQKLYKEYNISCHLGALKLSMFVDPERPHQEKPNLRLKAGECKALLPIFAALAVSFSDGCHIDLRTIAMFQAMSSFVDLMDSAPRHPSPHEGALALELFMEFLEHYQWLQLHRVNDHMWHTVGKFHTAKHMAMSFKYDNPRFTWAFKSEDYVGRISKICHSASYGTKALALSLKLTEKYRLMMFIRFWKGLYM